MAALRSGPSAASPPARKSVEHRSLYRRVLPAGPVRRRRVWCSANRKRIPAARSRGFLQRFWGSRGSSPTYGLVPAVPVSLPQRYSLDHNRPNVLGLSRIGAIMLQSLQATDPRRSGQRQRPVPDIFSGLKRAEGMRIGGCAPLPRTRRSRLYRTRAGQHFRAQCRLYAGGRSDSRRRDGSAIATGLVRLRFLESVRRLSGSHLRGEVGDNALDTFSSASSADRMFLGSAVNGAD